MRLQYSLRFLCLLTAILAFGALGLRFWMSRVTPEGIAEELNLAGARPTVWDHWNAMTYVEDAVEVDHVDGTNPCIGLYFDKLKSREALIAASRVTHVTELAIWNIDPELSVAGCDFTHLVDLHLGGASQQQLTEWLAATDQLTHLSLATNTGATGLDLSPIADVKSLKFLYLRNRKISGEDLSDLKRLPLLEHISFYGCQLDESAFDELASFPALTSLTCEGKTCNDETVRQLRDLTIIDDLDLSSSHITDRGVKILAEMGHLRDLSLYGCKQITADCVPDLMKMDFLDWLNVLASTVERDETLNANRPAMFIEWEM